MPLKHRSAAVHLSSQAPCTSDMHSAFLQPINVAAIFCTSEVGHSAFFTLANGWSDFHQLKARLKTMTVGSTANVHCCQYVHCIAQACQRNSIQGLQAQLDLHSQRAAGPCTALYQRARGLAVHPTPCNKVDRSASWS